MVTDLGGVETKNKIMKRDWRNIVALIIIYIIGAIGAFAHDKDCYNDLPVLLETEWVSEDGVRLAVKSKKNINKSLDIWEYTVEFRNKEWKVLPIHFTKAVMFQGNGGFVYNLVLIDDETITLGGKEYKRWIIQQD